VVEVRTTSQLFSELCYLTHDVNSCFANSGEFYRLNGGLETYGEACYSIIATTNLDELNDLVLPKLKTFAVANELCTGIQIQKLAKIMPNLRELYVGLGNDGFEMVCKVWSRLEKLEIHPFQVDEEGLLGIKIGEKCYHLPNITDLKGCLRDFACKKS